MKNLHIGKQIREKMKEKGISVSLFAKRINRSREAMYSIFKRKTIDTGLLQKVSTVLEYDFFQLYYSGDSNKEMETLRNDNKLFRKIMESQFGSKKTISKKIALWPQRK